MFEEEMDTWHLTGLHVDKTAMAKQYLVSARICVYIVKQNAVP